MNQVRNITAFFLLPLVAAFIWEFFSLAIGLAQNATFTVVPFWVGLGSYFVFQVVFFRPLRTYVFGHELTHALVGIMSGARLKSFKVSAHGGSVTLTKSGVLVALAPYFIPIYTLILVILFRALARFHPVDAWYPYFLFAAGFSLSFHFGLTQFALAQGQSDLKRFGIFFSSVLILLINCLVLAVLLKLIFIELVNIKGYLRDSLSTTEFIWAFFYHQGVHLWTYFQKMK